jgi:hypothetical protein
MNKDIYLMLLISILIFVYAPFVLSIVLVLYIMITLDKKWEQGNT